MSPLSGPSDAPRPSRRDTGSASFAWLTGGGETGRLLRAIDWSRTPVGPAESWPQSLRTVVSMMLESKFPMYLAWGREFTQFYNDPFRPILGSTKHPAVGKRSPETFPEIWDETVGPLFRQVREGQAVAFDDLMVPLERHGFLEECYFTFSYSPVRQEDGAVGGVLVTVAETTARVLHERRLRLLRDLAASLSRTRSVGEVWREAARVLEGDEADVPFAALYEREEGRAALRLRGLAGLSHGSPAAPEVTTPGDAAAPWPFPAATAGEPVTVVPVLAGPLASLPGGPWPEAARSAVVLPVAQPGLPEPYGVLVAGASPRLPLDESYRQFFRLVGDQLAAAVAAARAHEEERRRAEALAELDRAKTAFFSNVSHEFRTPLTLMLGPLEEALAGRHGDIPPALREELETTHRNALRLNKLVNNLLDFARIEAGRAQARYEPVDLAAFTRELAGTFRSAMERAGLRYDVDCPPLPEKVHVDRDMWEKVVLNLLSNALKFTFEGEVAVGLRWKGDHVELEVSDTGTGIAAQHLPRLFDRFHRVHGARARTHEGSGIGLALAQELVRQHGGELSVQSELGRGSTFRATVRTGEAHLPRERVGPARPSAPPAAAGDAFVQEALRWLQEEPAPAAAPEPDAPAGTEGAHVLVADDNADMRDYLRRVLGERWRVTTVGDGEAALAAAARERPDLVLADVMMPSLDGFALLRALRADERTQGLPVVLLTARAGEEARVEGLDAGADDYLVKPFSARELVARAATQIAAGRARRERERLLQREQAARREADLQRERLHSLFMQAPAPICILRGPEHVIELANPLVCQFWGRPPEEVIGRPLLEAVPEVGQQSFQDLLDGVVSSGQAYLGKEVRAELGPEGARRAFYFNFVYAPLRGLDGSVEGVLVIASDVTDEIRARDELARTVRFNETFAGILGHDLRNPLGAIMTAAQLLLLRRRDDDKVAAPARRILSSGERMTRMIDQILDFTRIRVGSGIRLEKGPVDLAQVVERVLGEVAAAAAGRFQTEVVGDPVGHWDADRLAQVVSNLASNAVQHGSPGAPVRVRLDGTDARKVTVRFQNEGLIPPDVLGVLFEPFRGTQSVQRNPSGLGLGLYITREIAVAHGGSVEAASDEPEGTRFTLVLPRHEDAAREAR